MKDEGGDFGMKIKIGVYVIQKKANSGPMGQILDRLQKFGEFEIIEFMDKTIIDDPIESWPICDCLIAFHSSGSPLEKAKAYAALRKPFLVNELEPHHLLHDRRKVYEQLQRYEVHVPRYALVNREVSYQEAGLFC